MSTADQPTQAEAALHYAARGFQVFPANPRTKAPLTDNGMKDATTDPDQISAWWREWPNALVACRIPEDQVVLDVDPRHGGDATWAELQKAYATILSARVHRSGRNDGGAHHWFKRPAGKLSAKKLHAWAYRNGTGHKAGENKWTSGIDILHHNHRYSILPPSPHPDTGLPYLWQSRDEPAEMPGFLADMITDDPPVDPTPPQSSGLFAGESIADWFTAHTTWNQILEPHGWALVSGDGNSDGSKWRHPRATAASSASVKHGCLFVYTPNTDLPETEQGDPRGITRFRAWGILNHRGDLSAAARAAGELRDGPRPADVPLGNLIAPNIDPTTGEIIDPVGRNLPTEFWQARPYLDHIRQAAHSRTLSADALLVATLCRVSVLVPPTIMLPPIVGSRGSLNLFAGIVAGSGASKTTTAEVAAELLPIDRRDIVTNSIGSGEGLVEQYFEMITEEVDGKKSRVKRQTRTAALVLLDEGQALAEMGSRSGSTLLPTLRSAWSGGRLGQANASAETHRQIDAHTYRMALLAGFQPGYAHGLIADAHGGTPQRFVFAHGLDPHTGDGEWPGELPWDPPAGIIGGTYVDVVDEVADPIRVRRRMVQRGEIELDELDSHADLVRLKVAALLGVLDGRLDVTIDDWELAGQIMRSSNAVRSWIIDVHRTDEREKERSRTARRVREESAVAAAASLRATESGARAIARKARREGRTITRREAHAATKSADRQLASLDDMLDLACDQGWLVRAGEGFQVGEKRP